MSWNHMPPQYPGGYPPYYGPPQYKTAADQIRDINDSIKAMEEFKKALHHEEKKDDPKIFNFTHKQWSTILWGVFPIIWIMTNFMFVNYMINTLTAMKVLAK